MRSQVFTDFSRPLLKTLHLTLEGIAMDSTVVPTPAHLDVPCRGPQNKHLEEQTNLLISQLQRQTEVPAVRELLSHFADCFDQSFRSEESYYENILEESEISDHRERHLFFINYLRDPVLVRHNDLQCSIEELSRFLKDWIDFHVHHLDKYAPVSRHDFVYS